MVKNCSVKIFKELMIAFCNPTHTQCMEYVKPWYNIWSDQSQHICNKVLFYLSQTIIPVHLAKVWLHVYVLIIKEGKKTTNILRCKIFIGKPFTEHFF